MAGRSDYRYREQSFKEFHGCIPWSCLRGGLADYLEHSRTPSDRSPLPLAHHQDLQFFCYCLVGNLPCNGLLNLKRWYADAFAANVEARCLCARVLFTKITGQNKHPFTWRGRKKSFLGG